MNKTLATIAAAATLITTTFATAPAAEAGGVRLQFGFPLGSFTARPCGSCGSSSSHRHRSYAAEKAARRSASAKARAARIRAAKAEARREAIAEAKAEARRERIAEARRQARLKKQRAAREEEAVAKLETDAIAPDAAPLPVRPQDQQRADVTIGEPKVIISNAKAAPAEKTEKVAIAPVPVKKAEAPAKPTDCKKFVPSAGLTITVPCQ